MSDNISTSLRTAFSTCSHISPSLSARGPQIPSLILRYSIASLSSRLSAQSILRRLAIRRSWRFRQALALLLGNVSLRFEPIQNLDTYNHTKPCLPRLSMAHSVPVGATGSGAAEIRSAAVGSVSEAALRVAGRGSYGSGSARLICKTAL